MATPNWKMWLTAWLRAQPAVANLAGTRVFTRMPASKTWPMVIVTRIGGGPVSGHANSLHDPLFQIDCFAPSEGDAHDVAAAALDALENVSGRVTAGGVTVTVSGSDVGAVHEGWDAADTSLARHRFSVRLWLRP